MAEYDINPRSLVGPQPQAGGGGLGMLQAATQAPVMRVPAPQPQQAAAPNRYADIKAKMLAMQAADARPRSGLQQFVDIMGDYSKGIAATAGNKNLSEAQKIGMAMGYLPAGQTARSAADRKKKMAGLQMDMTLAELDLKGKAADSASLKARAAWQKSLNDRGTNMMREVAASLPENHTPEQFQAAMKEKLAGDSEFERLMNDPNIPPAVREKYVADRIKKMTTATQAPSFTYKEAAKDNRIWTKAQQVRADTQIDAGVASMDTLHAVNNFREQMYSGKLKTGGLQPALSYWQSLAKDAGWDLTKILRKGGVELTDLSSAETAQAASNQLVLGILASGAMGRNPSNTDLQFVIKSMPSLGLTMEANMKILAQIEKIAERNIKKGGMGMIDMYDRDGKGDNHNLLGYREDSAKALAGKDALFQKTFDALKDPKSGHIGIDPVLRDNLKAWKQAQIDQLKSTSK